jgi:hypothetical protein
MRILVYHVQLGIESEVSHGANRCLICLLHLIVAQVLHVITVIIIKNQDVRVTNTGMILEY